MSLKKDMNSSIENELFVKKYKVFSIEEFITFFKIIEKFKNNFFWYSYILIFYLQCYRCYQLENDESWIKLLDLMSIMQKNCCQICLNFQKQKSAFTTRYHDKDSTQVFTQN